jgi:hypothetical protein
MLIALSNVNGILAINTIREDLVACVLEDDNDTLGIRWQNVRDKVTPVERESKTQQRVPPRRRYQ